jgi:hypothetical protein
MTEPPTEPPPLQWGEDEPTRSRPARGWDAAGPLAFLAPNVERSAIVCVLGVFAVPLALLGAPLAVVPAMVSLAVAPGATVQMRRRALDPRAGRPRGTRWQIRIGVVAAVLAVVIVAFELLLSGPS